MQALRREMRDMCMIKFSLNSQYCHSTQGTVMGYWPKFTECCGCRVRRWPHCAGAGAHARAGGADPAGVHQVWVVLPHQEHVRAGQSLQAPGMQPLRAVLNRL